MNKKEFLISEVLREGWVLTKANIDFLIGYQIVMVFVSFLLYMSNDKPLLLRIGLRIIEIIVYMGFFNSALLITKNIKPTLAQLYSNWRQFFSWLIASMLFSIMFVVGLFLLIIPGFYVWGRFGLFPFFILDKELGPIDGLKQAYNVSEGMASHLVFLYLACAGINFIGLLLLGFGLLITAPITLLSLAIVYRKLQNSNVTRNPLVLPEIE